ncbi:ammonium transporter [Guillardia theta CCMP2712]|uniref:Ammonium transporter n=1 Tax=Guillardia theta (strain CCMP2712) TaxID=905079 RepID=L1ITD7_GUITC|nr:ammonium transporter [Guillardia theta CCMP2712]EKX39531.1 ammonium transporter [Guillardia theta CCMP2712]|eukprot:XP_005826511.1 ammonium transporter [Guillardia theta CCMP2712]
MQKAHSGDTSWMLMSTALVVMMTTPGLAMFYGGLAQAPNVLSTVMQSFSIMCIVSFLWFAMGYSFAFAEGSVIVGNSSKFWLAHMDGHRVKDDSEKLFMVYQMTFAVISAAIICGSFAERMRFSAMLVFVAIWHLLVYCPVAHWAWGPGGFLHAAGCLDFAGGDVVHVSAGVTGLVASMLVGKRRSLSLGQELTPHNALLVFLGASLLWVGWFGFNAGSSFAADDVAINAMAATQMSGACGGLTWMIVEWVYAKKPSVVGIVSGSISGLVVVTPSCGYIDQTGAVCIGALGGLACFFSIQLKHVLGYDDALDAFGMHGIGGVLGCILTGFFANKHVSGKEEINGAFYGKPSQIYIQLYGVVVISVYCAVMTFLILKPLDLTLGIGIRCSPEEESQGLDISQHGESLIVDASLLGSPKVVPPLLSALVMVLLVLLVR